MCYAEYEDYMNVSVSLWKHIEGDDHKKKLKSNRFNSYILDLEKHVRSEVGERKT